MCAQPTNIRAQCFYACAAYYDKGVAYYYVSVTMPCKCVIDLQVFLQNVVCLLSKTSKPEI